ncbi:MAG: SDR family NAD(P)-dependent oxidoreductase [Atopobiaceae bacterium]|nr:SDR family NAD(P)-dependent oxidoreductase [Atopobiaceae bacterium]
MQRIALVTGASSGVGKEFVRQLDLQRGGPLDAIWAIARSKDSLQEVARSCTNIPVLPIPLDLTRDESFSRIQEMLETQNVVVEWLVNSAGFGKFGDFVTVGDNQNASMVQLNCLALVRMCSIVLPHMHSGSRVINMASIAGAIPQVMLATYSATKAFVLELSRMLDHELAPCGIRVTAVCPKFMKTKFLDEPGDSQSADGMCRIGFEDVSHVVSKAIDYAIMGKATCIPSLHMKLLYAASRCMPRSVLFKLEDILFR